MSSGFRDQCLRFLRWLTTTRGWISTAGLIGVIVLGVFGALHLQNSFTTLSNPRALISFVEGFGIAAPIVFISLVAIQVLVSPVPGQIFAIAGGFLFGTIYGTLYSMVGLILGSYIAFMLSRRFGRGFVSRVVGDDRLERFDQLIGDRAVGILFIAFLVPGLPDDVLCFVGGVTNIKTRQFLLVSIFGRLPSYLLISFLGHELYEANYVSAIMIAFILIAIGIVSYRYRDVILRRVRSGIIRPNQRD
ncbi:MAG: TVP38/TMEM64 family protein [Halobacteriaceae archaeon]